MSLDFILQLLFFVCITAGLMWFIWSRWYPRRMQPLSSYEHNTAHLWSTAQSIIEQGGPYSFADYMLLFPKACPCCGSRSLYIEPQLDQLSIHTLPFTNTTYAIQYRWWCRRCGSGTDESLVDHETQTLRVVTSPYLDPEIATLIPEPVRVAGTTIPQMPANRPVHPPSRAAVLIENDDTTPMAFVVTLLVEVFGLSVEQAGDVMLQAHHYGESVILLLPLEEVEHHMASAYERARIAGFPLRFRTVPQQRAIASDTT